MVKNKSALNETIFDSRLLNVVFFLCSVMVIGIHSYNISDDAINTIPAYIEGFLCRGVFVSAVPIFFFISGYLFFRNIESIGAVLKKMKTRIKSVLMPFLVWSALYYAVFAVGSHTPLFSDVVSLEPIDILLGVVFYRYCIPLWYMYQLVMFVILTPLIYKLTQKRFVGLAFLTALAVFVAFVTDSADIKVFDNENGSRALFQFNYFCYYFSGCLLVRFSDYAVKLKDFIKKHQKAVAAISFVVLVGFSFLQSLIFDKRISFFYERFFEPVVVAALFIFIACFYKKLPYVKNVSTMIVYGAHPLIVAVVSKFFTQLPALAAFVITFALTTIISFVFAYVLKRFMKPIHYVLSGGR